MKSLSQNNSLANKIYNPEILPKFEDSFVGILSLKYDRSTKSDFLLIF